MATAETARLIASLELQDKNFTRGLAKVEGSVNRVDKKLGAFSGFVNRNLGRAIDSIAVRLIGAVGTGLNEMATLEDAATSVAGAISQVGPGWTTTADDIVAAANRIEGATDAAFDDKAIVAATETLIRYGKVSEQNLEPAMEVMTDLAARTGDVESAATLLAKALADPEKAAGKLARAGVVLTKEQQKQIKALVKAGKVTEAQTLLLEELEKTTKGAAAASAGPYRDALNKLGDAGEDLRRGLVTGLAPALIEVADLLTDELAKPSTIEALKTVGRELGSALKGVIATAKSLPWDTIGDSLKLAGTGAKAVLDAFLGLPPWVQTAVLTGWGLNKLTGGALSNIVGALGSGLIRGVLGMNAGVVNINAGVVNGAGGGLPGIVGKAGGWKAIFGAAFRLAVGTAIGAAIASVVFPEFGGQIRSIIAPGTNPARQRGETRRGGEDARPEKATREFSSQIKGVGDKTDKVGAKTDEVKAAVNESKTAINASKAAAAQNARNLAANQQRLAAEQKAVTRAGTVTVSGVTKNVGSNVRSGTAQEVGTLFSVAAMIVGAIWASGAANRPIVQSTTVVQKYQTIQRTGQTGDSRNRSGPLE